MLRLKTDAGNAMALTKVSAVQLQRHCNVLLRIYYITYNIYVIVLVVSINGMFLINTTEKITYCRVGIYYKVFDFVNFVILQKFKFH